MKDNNICPNCNEEVELGWDTCWNCQTKITPTTTTMEDNANLTSGNKTEERVYVKVDSKRIVYAGKQLKYIAKLLTLSILVTLITTIIVLISPIPAVYYIAGIINLVILVIILLSLFQAGNDLEKSIPPEE
ncbi:MAG: hypothetical protein MI922_21010 [Bacteroidales bacterium]|nr:hypothetical protein [Bacteroidales bacterium]